MKTDNIKDRSDWSLTPAAIVTKSVTWLALVLLMVVPVAWAQSAAGAVSSDNDDEGAAAVKFSPEAAATTLERQLHPKS